MIRKSILLILAFSASACATAPQQQPAGGILLSDGQVAMILQVANEGEVRHGQLASTRAASAEVRSFAEMMVRDHGDALARAQDVFARARVVPEESEISRTLRTGAEQTANALSNMSGAEFDRVYMRSQVEMHEWLLRSIDTSLRPSVRSSALMLFLREQRESIARHADQARRTRDAVR